MGEERTLTLVKVLAGALEQIEQQRQTVIKHLDNGNSHEMRIILSEMSYWVDEAQQTIEDFLPAEEEGKKA